MRIISGELKGTKLYLTSNKETRPLKDLARESIFNLLTHSNKIFFQLEKSVILDLYAGTGSFGLECLSRQAKNVFFIEKDKNAIEILKKNIDKLKLKNKTKIFFSEIFKLIEKSYFSEFKFDLIFCDPPFKSKNISRLIETIYAQKILKRNGIIIIHRNKNASDKFPNFFNILEIRKYGMSKIIFGKFLS